MDLGNKKDQWVCPNDRQLALRAKLQTGWSVKTQRLNSFSQPEPLSESEQSAILKVIQRAEMIELTEQERIGRLVDRLDNIKKHVLGNGANQCILCGDTFRVLSGSPQLCHDCRKAVCQKCVIETVSSQNDPIYLCKICAETREMWKKSGAWFFKGLPKYKLPEKKASEQSRLTSRYITRSQRPGLQRSFTQWAHEQGRKGASEQEDESSSEDEMTKRAKENAGKSPDATTGRKNDATAAAAAATRDEVHELQRLSPKPNSHLSGDQSDRLSSKSGNSSTVQMETLGLPWPPIDVTSADPNHEAQRLYARRISREWSVSNDAAYSDATATLLSATLRRPSYARQTTVDVASLQSYNSNKRHGLHEDYGLLQQQSSNNGGGSVGGGGGSGSGGGSGGGMRRLGVMPRSPLPSPSPSSQQSSEGWWDPDSSMASATSSAGSRLSVANSVDSGKMATTPTSSSNELTVVQPERRDFSPDDIASLGTLEFSLLYDSANKALHCTVHRAKSLRATDSNGLTDAFCRMSILPYVPKSMKLRTKTVHKTVNPEFNETLTMSNISEEDLTKKTLQILVIDDDKYGQDVLGETRIPLKRLKSKNTKYFNVYLERHDPRDVLEESEEWSRGQIRLSLCYAVDRCALIVGIVRCTNLAPMDNNGFSDPFVKVQLRPNRNQKRYKTAVKWKNLNPEFHEDFAFDTRLPDLSNQTLDIAVWDKDYGKSNDYIGGLQLGPHSKGERLRHWNDVLRVPNVKHERWHQLVDDHVTDGYCGSS